MDYVLGAFGSIWVLRNMRHDLTCDPCRGSSACSYFLWASKRSWDTRIQSPCHTCSSLRGRAPCGRDLSTSSASRLVIKDDVIYLDAILTIKGFVFQAQVVRHELYWSILVLFTFFARLPSKIRRINVRPPEHLYRYSKICSDG